MPYQLNVFTGTLDRVNSSSSSGGAALTLLPSLLADVGYSTGLITAGTQYFIPFEVTAACTVDAAYLNIVKSGTCHFEAMIFGPIANLSSLGTMTAIHTVSSTAIVYSNGSQATSYRHPLGMAISSAGIYLLAIDWQESSISYAYHDQHASLYTQLSWENGASFGSAPTTITFDNDTGAYNNASSPLTTIRVSY